MALLKQVWFRNANDVVHDLASACWPGAVLGLAVFRMGMVRYQLGPKEVAAVLGSWTGIWAILFIAVAVNVATGIPRLRYKAMGLRPEKVAVRARSAVWKHVGFVSVLVASTVWAFFLLRA
jgi:hypothetical protein